MTLDDDCKWLIVLLIIIFVYCADYKSNKRQHM